MFVEGAMFHCQVVEGRLRVWNGSDRGVRAEWECGVGCVGWVGKEAHSFSSRFIKLLSTPFPASHT